LSLGFPRAITEQITGLMISATNSELLSVMISVMGRYFMKSPISPGQNSMGEKAAMVVAVEVMTGQATSLVPFIDACTRG